MKRMLLKRSVFAFEGCSLDKVEWGLTKALICPENIGSNHLMVNVTVYSAGATHEMHVHNNQEEVIFIIEGNGLSQTLDDSIEIGPGSVVIIPAGVEHATINLSRLEPMKALIIKSPVIKNN
jgi:quercetin dioxygenase-like cupin family protein